MSNITNIDTDTINIPKRLERSEIVLNMEFTSRQRYLIERAISNMIWKNSPELFTSTLDNDDIWSMRSTATRRSMGELCFGWGSNFKMDIETAEFLAETVMNFSNTHLGRDRGERMVASRIVNSINNFIDYQLNNSESAYINQVLSIKRLAKSEFTPIDYHIDVEATNREFRLHAKQGDEWYSLATAYINTSTSIDESGEMAMSFFVNTSGWLSDNGEKFTNLADAKVAAEALITQQIREREARQINEITEAKEVVKAMGFTDLEG